MGLSRSTEKSKSSSGIFFRVFIDLTNITFQNDNISPPNELNLTIKSIVFSSTLSPNVPPSFALNLTEIFLVEKHSHPNIMSGDIIENTLLSFSIQNPNEDSLVIPNHIFDAPKPVEATAFSGPQVEISIILKPITEDGINISIQFHHAKCVLSLDTIDRWSSVLSESFGTQTSPSSSLSFSCSIGIKSIDLILKESPEMLHNQEERRKQRENLPSITQLQDHTYKNRWKKSHSQLNKNSKLSTTSLRFVFHGISILINPNLTISPFSITMDKINCFMQIPDRPSNNLWELGFFSIRGGLTETKIKIIKEKYQGPEGVTSKSIQEESERLLLGDVFEMPTLDIQDNIVVSAGQIQTSK